MGEVLKFEPPEASQERQEKGNEVIDLLGEKGQIEKKLEDLNRQYIAELPRLNDKLTAAQARVGLAKTAAEQVEYIGIMEEALKELKALEKPIEDLLEQKAMLAYKLEQVRQKQEEGQTAIEVGKAIDEMGDKWLAAGERMTERMGQLVALKEEAVDALERDFLARGEKEKMAA